MSETTVDGIGRAYADVWAAAAQRNDVQHLVRGFPIIPKDIDAPLLREADQMLGSLRHRESERRAIRRAFQQRLAEIAVELDEEPSI